MVVLQTILLLIIVYYVLKIVLKWLAPKLFNYAVQKTEERFGQQFGAFQQQNTAADREGETTIHTSPKRKGGTTKKVGEYIDFEEIE